MAGNAQQTTEAIVVPDADREAARVWGRALKVLRTRSDLTLDQAGGKAGITGPGWYAYEIGKSPAIFRPSVQRKLSEALGQGPLALQEEHARVAATAAANPVHDYPGLPDARP